MKKSKHYFFYVQKKQPDFLGMRRPAFFFFFTLHRSMLIKWTIRLSCISELCLYTRKTATLILSRALVSQKECKNEIPAVLPRGSSLTSSLWHHEFWPQLLGPRQVFLKYRTTLHFKRAKDYTEKALMTFPTSKPCENKEVSFCPLTGVFW